MKNTETEAGAGIRASNEDDWDAGMSVAVRR